MQNTFEKLPKGSIEMIRFASALLFVFGVFGYTLLSNSEVSNNLFLGVAALVGAYMAINIGANDVANNVGPAVGSKALTLFGAIAIAAVFEASGALIAGGDVVSTIKKGIIDIAAFDEDPDLFIWAMLAALLGAALWLNLATALKAPVSTTHSIVGGVMGAGIAAAGIGIVAFKSVAAIVLSWIVSPLLGGLIAAGFLYTIKKNILFQKDKKAAAQRFVPLYIALMAWAFTSYLILKGMKKIWPQFIEMLNTLFMLSLPVTKKPEFLTALLSGFVVALALYFILKSYYARKSTLQNSQTSLNALFNIPLVFAAALLSFAHGANDVANAIGPLAAINDAIINGGISAKASIPLWVMSVGAFGIVLGLWLFGPGLIRSVGNEITELDQIRAFCVAMAAALTVIIASQLGLPVSSTHIAIGAIFGVGFLREYLQKNNANYQEQNRQRESAVIAKHKEELHAYQNQKEKTVQTYRKIVALYETIEQEEKQLKSGTKVHREMVKKIVAAWIITLPATALLSALLFYMLRGIML